MPKRPWTSSRRISLVGTPSMRISPPVQLVELHEQVDHGGLARTGRAYDGHLLAGQHVLAKVVDDDPVLGVAELHVLELHLAADGR